MNKKGENIDLSYLQIKEMRNLLKSECNSRMGCIYKTTPLLSLASYLMFTLDLASLGVFSMVHMNLGPPKSGSFGVYCYPRFAHYGTDSFAWMLEPLHKRTNCFE